MSEQLTYSATNRPTDPLLEHFGYTQQKSIPVSVLTQLNAISGIFSARSIDPETSTAIIKSYELKHGSLEDPHLRIARFREFIANIHAFATDREPFLDTIKNLGLLSKHELESYGIESGDWGPFLRRAEKDAKH